MTGETQPERAVGTAEPNSADNRPGKRWFPRGFRRLAPLLVLAVGGFFTALGLALLLACHIDDRSIEQDMGIASAEVVEKSYLRTVVRFNTDSGRVYTPPNGVLYPVGLQEGQLVSVEFDRGNPDLVRVGGRNMSVAILPIGSALAVLWAIVLPAYWLTRRAVDARSSGGS
ncbi:hypothetical protein SAMN04487820_102179 [Actinopolyspora mzabensis]|uniref:DUF3592 domain-containing protein n=1 Tax=Actinopolyspora mzabensis TaxID=995066 RepID=A0A1G8WSK8_ACTMZ|nr:DUF3592 domain-containing protein [Actinopolyspora mzabensis]SDJ80615.1 hypothetical protein SAMN04487820_102179 [Actinopolyspora mzabensis]